MEEFDEDNEMKYEASLPISRYFSEEFAAEEKRKIAARLHDAQAGGGGAEGGGRGGEPEFISAAGNAGLDASAAFGTQQEAQRLLNLKQLSEVEELLQRALGKAADLALEVEGEERRNAALRNVLVELKTRKLELEDRLEDYTREIENRGSVKGKNAKEEEEFRRLEARMKKEEARRKAQELGLEEDEDTSSALDKFDRFGILALLKQVRRHLRVLITKYDPTYVDSRIAESRFGSGIALYFWFFRFVIQVTLALWIVLAVLLVLHLVNFSANARPVTLISTLPSFLLHSSIDHTLALDYAVSILVCVCILAVAAGGKVSYEVIIKNQAEVRDLGQDPKRYAKLAFTAWDWGTTDLNAAHDLKATVAQNFQVLKLEDEMDERIRARTRAEWRKLTAKRIAGVTFNSLTIAGGAGVIVYATFALQGGSSGGGSGLLDTILGLVPTLLPTAINGMLPTITKACVGLEAWDEPTFSLKMLVFRMYLGKMINALIQVGIILILFRGPGDFGLSEYDANGQPDRSGRIEKRNCAYLSCEDQVGAKFFTLFATDVVVGSVSNVAVHAGTFFAFTYVKPDPLKAKKEFEPPKEFIKILYQQIFVWLMLPHFPFGALIALPMWFLQFKADNFVLLTFNAKPVRPFDAKDSGVYFAMFYGMTLFIFLGWFYYLFFILSVPGMDVPCCDLARLVSIGNSTLSVCIQNVSASPEACMRTGLDANGLPAMPTPMFPAATPISYMRDVVRGASPVGDSLIRILNTPLLGWFCASVIVIAYLLERMRVSVLDEFLDKKWAELDHQRLQMEQQIQMRQRRINIQASMNQGK